MEHLKALFDRLHILGFEGERLTGDIKRYISAGLTKFTVRHHLKFSGESLSFELFFNKLDESGYQLETIKAAYLRPVAIEHSTDCEGIDTASLEIDMQEIDWETYFKGVQAGEEENNKIAACIRRLTTLHASDNIGANEIQQQLIYKYWPRKVYELYKHPQIRHMALDHECKGEYRHEGGLPGVWLIYNTLSGKLDDLYEKLKISGIEEFTGIDLEAMLKTRLSYRPDNFNLICSENRRDGLIEFEIPVRYEHGAYEADIYGTTFTPHPEIEHGIYNGIDSAELERMMKEIDWLDDRQLFHPGEDPVPDFLPKVNDVQEQIFRLSQDYVGLQISDKLKLKYWIGATFFGDNIEESAWEELNERQKIRFEFPLDFNAESLFNLACGRAVMDRTASLIEGTGIWFRLGNDGQPERIEGFAPGEVERQLRMLVTKPMEFVLIRETLFSGGIAGLDLEDGRRISIVADPKVSVLRLSTSEDKPIPFNFKLDPDWRPAMAKTERKQKTNRKGNRL